MKHRHLQKFQVKFPKTTSTKVTKERGLPADSVEVIATKDA
jgi:hypothetical protein